MFKPILPASLLIMGLLVMHSCNKTPTSVYTPQHVNAVATGAAMSLSETSLGSLRVFTLAGSSTPGNTDGAGGIARFSAPVAVTTDTAGNMYVADLGNNSIRKITAGGTVSTLAGTAAAFNEPSGIAVDAAGNIYVGDARNHVIRKVTATGVTSTLAGTAGVHGSTDGPGPAALFFEPRGVAIDGAGNLYVADAANHKIRKISPAGLVSTLAGTGTPGTGNGPGPFAQFNTPTAVATDAAGNVYVTDGNNNKIRKITPGGSVSTLAGGGVAGNEAGFADGTGINARFMNPAGISVDAAGNVLVADEFNHAIRMITPAGVVSTLAGTNTASFADGVPAVARFNRPAGIAVDANGNVIIADRANNRLRSMGVTVMVSTVAGTGVAGMANGPGATAQFYAPVKIITDAAGNAYVSDAYNHCIRKITPAGMVSTFAGIPSPPLAGSYADGPSNVARFNGPNGLAFDAAGNLYVSDQGNARIRKITPAGVVSTFAGGVSGFAEGIGTAAKFDSPADLTIDAQGNLYVTDFYNHRVRKITPAGVVTTLAGTGIGYRSGGYADGPGNTAQFKYPNGITIDAAGSLYVTDSDNNRVRKITTAGFVTTIAGSGITGFSNGPAATAQFNGLIGITVDLSGNLYVVDARNNRVRKITPAGIVSTLAGSAAGPGFFGSGFLDGPGNIAQFGLPGGITIDVSGALYLTDTWNNRIRKIQ